MKNKKEQIQEMLDNRCFPEDIKHEPKDNVKGFMFFSNEEYDPNLQKLKGYQYKHRYYYYEQFKNNPENSVIFIMFNPSTACPQKDDQTIKNCRTLAKKKYDSMEIINILSERNPVVDDIEGITDIISNSEIYKKTMNYKFVKKLLEKRVEMDIVIAWGFGKEDKYKKIITPIKQLIEDNRVYKITITQHAFDKFKDLARHPGATAWSAYGGFDDKSAELTKIKVK